MADWDESSPGDSDVISNYPSNARAARSAAKTNFGIDHVETDGATVGMHEAIRAIDQVSDPASAAGRGVIYAKTVSGVVELCYRGSDGNVVQLTTGGVLRVADAAITNAKLANMAQATIKGRASGAGTGVPVDLTATQLLTILLAVDGASSGLDADLLDGQHGSYYQNAGNLNAGTIPAARIGASGVTQHQASLAVNATQVATTRSTSTTLVARQMHAISSGATVNSGTAGEWVAIYNNSASPITLTQGSGVTLRLGGTTTTGNRTLAPRTMAVIWYNTATDVIVSGSGVS